MTCFHEFQIYESTNFSDFILKQGRILLLRSKNVAISIFFHKKRHFAATLKEKKEKKFAKKKFVDSAFVKTCHKQVDK